MSIEDEKNNEESICYRAASRYSYMLIIHNENNEI